MIRFSHLLMFSLLASCTLGPNYRRPRFYDKAQVQQSLHINGNEAAGVSLDWYRRFNDPVLTGLIEQGLRESPLSGRRLPNFARRGQVCGLMPSNFCLPSMEMPATIKSAIPRPTELS